MGEPNKYATVLPLLVFRLVVGGFVLAYLPYSILSSHPIPPVTRLRVLELLGVIAIAVGTAAYLVCVLDFAAKGGFTPREIVARGMYRFVRNPMYVGLVAVLLGESALFRSWRLLGYALALWLVLHLLVVLHEERGLAKAFGDSFTRYRERVPRWIPRVSRLRRDGSG